MALLAAGAGAIFVALIAVGLLLAQFFASDKLALHAMGAREVTPAEAPEFHAMIERLCVQADLPKPRVAVADTDMPNAFAIGRSPSKATVCATTGIMQMLTPAELEGRDGARVDPRAEPRRARDDDRLASSPRSPPTSCSSGSSSAATTTTTTRSSCCCWCRSPCTSLSFFLMQALSRYREFAADRGSGIITGRPSALASALLKISGTMDRIPQKDLRATGELSAFYIFPPAAKASIGNLFSTHPPMEKRIAALQRLESQLQGVPA